MVVFVLYNFTVYKTTLDIARVCLSAGGLDVLEKGKMLCTCGELNPGFQIVV
jgi:hypothetical protein